MSVVLLAIGEYCGNVQREKRTGERIILLQTVFMYISSNYIQLVQLCCGVV